MKAVIFNYKPIIQFDLFKENSCKGSSEFEIEKNMFSKFVTRLFDTRDCVKNQYAEMEVGGS